MKSDLAKTLVDNLNLREEEHKAKEDKHQHKQRNLSNKLSYTPSAY